MVNKDIDEEVIFNAAIQFESRDKRDAYLAKACGTDEKLRADVEALLKAHYEAKSLLDEPVAGPEVTLGDSALTEGPGTTIGRYKLLELIGEGGMGLVYLAEQQEPVRRRVALKITKPGMDSKRVITRFEAEQQTLALLDHPNIAHVFDAGTTETGRPYFVMEYVKGMPITKYCDRHKLNIEQRLKLFLQVCYGLQHAHQKGIIHRDIKPFNILISVQDDRAVPKIIDFGIAKAITQPLTEETLFTRQGQLLGTPEYMSPEQADMGSQDIDTRADIYSLGVVLYELLSGALPFEHEVLERVGFAEVQRILQEEEPPRPSLRLTALGEEAKEIAERRHTQVVTLARRLHRELEWIPLKAMRKDRSRRYRSASELADDIQNYLNGAPLIAGPETAIYRVRKFVSKHAGSVATAILVAATLLIGLCLATVGFAQASRERNIAETQRQRARMNFQMARDAVDEMTRVVEQQLVNVSGTEQVRRELLQKAQVFYASFAEKNRDDEVVRQEIALAYHRVGQIHIELGNFFKAREALRQAISLLETLTAEFPGVPEYRVQLFDILSEYAYTFIWTYGQQEMLRVRTKLLALLQTLVSDFPTVVEYKEKLAFAHTDLGNTLKLNDRWKEAETHFRQALAVWQQLYLDFPDEPKNLWGLAHGHHWLGAHLLKTEELEEAEEHLGETLELREQLLAEDPNSDVHRGFLASIKWYVGRLLVKQARPEEAARQFREAIAIRGKLLEEYPAHIEHRRRLGLCLHTLAKTLMESGQAQEAEEAMREAIAHIEKLTIDLPEVEGFKWNLARQLAGLGQILSKAGQPEEALQTYRRAIEIGQKLAANLEEGRYLFEFAEMMMEIGEFLNDAGQLEEAEKAFRQAQAILEQQVSDFPDRQPYREALATTYLSLRDVLERMGRPDEAQEAFQKAQEVEEEVVTEETEDSNE